jgi:hypothetical protein
MSDLAMFALAPHGARIARRRTIEIVTIAIAP